MTKTYQISQDMDIETMPHAVYFTGDLDSYQNQPRTLSDDRIQ